MKISFMFRLFIGFTLLIRPFLTSIAFILSFFIPKLTKRRHLENKNRTLPFYRSFKKDQKRADFCFEVSSEGELEQVRPLLERMLTANKKVELIYSSDSVEKKIDQMASLYPEILRVQVMPLLSSGPFTGAYFQNIGQWITAPTLIFCRYDFFPELLILKKSSNTFVLASAATKKLSWFKKEVFKLFDVVIAANQFEEKAFRDLLDKKVLIENCDFRIPRIAERLSTAFETLEKLPYLKNYLNYLDSLEADKKVIFGSLWPSDLAIFKNNPSLIEEINNKKMHFLIAPHKLSDEFVKELKESLELIFGRENVGIINKENHQKIFPVTILQQGGVLCELYLKFSMAYVGGGYERSIHSVFEPFFANCEVITGGNISRSTEFDYINQELPSEIHVLKNPEFFYNKVMAIKHNKQNLQKRAFLIEETKTKMNEILIHLIKE